MVNVEEIKVAIESLPKNDYYKIKKWIFDKDWGKWDGKIEEDSGNGRLDFLIIEASREKEKGCLKKL